MQKRASPLLAVDLHVVFVVCRDAGMDAAKLRSTFTGTFPGARGNDIASNVKLPVPKGKEQVFEAEASPVQ
jgi:hypothetical protein